MTKTITLAIVLDHKLAQSLGGCAARNFLHDQPHRFEVIAVDEPDTVDSDDVTALAAAPYAGGTLTWCGTLSDALLLRAFEQASGYPTAVLWDLAGAQAHDGYVLLSGRRYRHG